MSRQDFSGEPHNFEGGDKPYVLLEIVGGLGEPRSELRDRRITAIADLVLGITTEYHVAITDDHTGVKGALVHDELGNTAARIHREAVSGADTSRKNTIKSDQQGYYTKLRSNQDRHQTEITDGLAEDPDKLLFPPNQPNIAQFVVTIGTEKDILARLPQLGSEGPVERALRMSEHGGWMMWVMDAGKGTFRLKRGLRERLMQKFDAISNKEVHVAVDRNYTKEVLVRPDVSVVTSRARMLDELRVRNLIVAGVAELELHLPNAPRTRIRQPESEPASKNTNGSAWLQEAIEEVNRYDRQRRGPWLSSSAGDDLRVTPNHGKHSPVLAYEYATYNDKGNRYMPAYDRTTGWPQAIEREAGHYSYLRGVPTMSPVQIINVLSEEMIVKNTTVAVVCVSEVAILLSQLRSLHYHGKVPANPELLERYVEEFASLMDAVEGGLQQLEELEVPQKYLADLVYQKLLVYEKGPLNSPAVLPKILSAMRSQSTLMLDNLTSVKRYAIVD
jgi:hypothetical protein